MFGNQELGKDAIGIDEIEIENSTVSEVRKTTNYVSQSAVALRCRVMPPPCFKNPYLKDASQMDIDPYGNQRSKCAGTPFCQFIKRCYFTIIVLRHQQEPLIHIHCSNGSEELSVCC